jgi:hypothetical protein
MNLLRSTSRLSAGPLLVATAVLLLVAACAGAPAAPGPTAASAPLPNTPAGGQADGAGGQTDDAAAPADEALIVYAGSLALEVGNVQAALARGRQIVTAVGGYVAASKVSNSGSDESAYITYRIPAPRWEESLSELRGLAERIVDEQISSQDVSAQVVDLDARVANARTTETALQGFMDRARTIDDVLKVQGELTTVRGEIERMTAQRDHLAGRAAYGTLDVSYRVPVTASAVAAEGWDAAREIDASLAALVRIGQSLGSVLIWVAIVGLPVVVPFLLLVWLGLRLRRRWLINHPPAAADQGGWR